MHICPWQASTPEEDWKEKKIESFARNSILQRLKSQVEQLPRETSKEK